MAAALLAQIATAQVWKEEAKGDMNHDGYMDAVIVVNDSAENKESTPVLSIYFGNESGQLNLWRQYKALIPASDSITFYETELTINDRGVLRITISSFSAMGSAYSCWQTSVFRFQDNDFYCIGKDTRAMSRMTGEEVTESFNYLTCKCQRIVGNVFDEDVKPRETWRRIPKQALRRLGEEELF